MLTYFVCDIQKRMMTNSVALWSVCMTVRSSSGLAGISVVHLESLPLPEAPSKLSCLAIGHSAFI